MIQRRTAGINNGTPDAFGAVEHSYKRPRSLSRHQRHLGTISLSLQQLQVTIHVNQSCVVTRYLGARGAQI